MLNMGITWLEGISGIGSASCRAHSIWEEKVKVRFTSAKTAIHYFFNHQLMTPEDDIAKLWVRVQYTVKGGSGATWLSMELADLIRPLNQLKPLPYAWAMYAFAGDGHYTNLQVVALSAHIVSECRKVCGINSPNHDMCRKLLLLAKAALEDSALREVTGRAKYSDADFCRRIGVKHANWTKCWEQKLRAMQVAIDSLSRQALQPVSAKLHQVAELGKTAA